MEKMYWEVENYSDSVINLMEEGEKIFSEQLTKKQVENFTGKKLRVAKSYENPQIIVSAMVLENSQKYLDARKKRGARIRYYMIEN